MPAPLSAFRRVWQPDWSKLEMRVAMRCTLGIAICLLIGLMLKMPAVGVLAASGALGAGFGAFERIRGSSAIPMLLATIGMGASVFTGSVFGHSDLAYTILAGVTGLCCGLLVGVATSFWYVGLQWAIAGLVAGEFTGDASTAAQHTALLVAGGLFQTLVVLLLRKFRPLASPVAPPDTLDTRDTLRVIAKSPVVLHAIRRRLRLKWNVWLEAIRLSLALAACAWLTRYLGLAHGYWGPMTTLLVMKSDLHLTIGRGVARVAGTLAGVVVTALIGLAVHPGPVLLCCLAVLSAWLAFSLLKVNYATYSICITAYVVFQLAFLGLPAAASAMERGFATLLGFVCALLAHLAWNVQNIVGRRRAIRRAAAGQGSSRAAGNASSFVS